jgi:5'-nucleotidase/UDP-sugar diphosphatase
MTGEQIKNVLEDAMNFFLDPNGAQGAYPRASGLRFDINEAKPFGSRVSNLEINPKLEGSWSKIDMSATYKVIANNFIAGGKDGYFEFKKVPDDKKVDTFVEYAQSFIDYAKSVNTLTSVSDDRASTQEWSDSLRPSVGADESGCATKNMKITLFSALVIFVSIWA